MDIIVISPEKPIMGEHETMNWLFENGLDRYHARRPNGNIEDLRKVINRVPKVERGKASLHSHHELAHTYTPCGIHHTSTSTFNDEFNGVQSKSFHSIEEIISNTYDYHFGLLSPIFPSISKEGYQKEFDLIKLKTINESNSFPIYALGGISPDTVQHAKDLGFSGVVLYGAIWNEIRWTKLQDNFKRILDICKG